MHRLAVDMEVLPFDAFLAGLLQNVGLIVTLRMMDGPIRSRARRLNVDALDIKHLEVALSADSGLA